MSGHQRIAIPDMTVDKARAIIGARYAQMIAGSVIRIEWHYAKRGLGAGWHYVVRYWPQSGKSMSIGHARSKVNAEAIAQEFRELDRLALIELVSEDARAA